MEKFKEVYIEEIGELLADIESALLELGETPEKKQLIDRVFRAFHTIKGSGAMFGFDRIVTFTHDIETVLDLVRRGIIPMKKSLVDLALASCDHIRKMAEDDSADGKDAENIVRLFRKMIPEDYQTADSPAPEKSPEKSAELSTCRIRFRPDPDIFYNGSNPILLLDEIRNLGECQIIAHTHTIPALRDLNPQKCYIHWNIILTTSLKPEAIREVFIFAEDKCRLNIDLIQKDEITDENGKYKKIGDILLERGDITPADLKKALESQRKIGEMLVAAGATDSDTVASALAEQEHVRNLSLKNRDAVITSSIRVAAEKLDILVDLVGELVTVQASLSQRSLLLEDPEMISIAEEVERLTAELRDNTISIRLVPVSTIFGKFKRLVYDLSSELGKSAAMETQGGETELDKTVIDRLNDPIMHIIRNAIGHGIESPEERIASGKPVKGNILLAAEHAGTNVLIRISDDGAGLDPLRIRKKAVSMGLIPPDAELSENELFSLIFLPGFSTTGEISEISGRGVGMDVVKRCIENLRGSVELSSRKGVGTSITMKLPLTLAIIEGLLVEVGPTAYILPLSVVEECMELTQSAVKNARGRNLANVRGEIIPYIHLRDFFRIEGERKGVKQIVIVRLNNLRVGLVVDNIVGEHQTVIKSLGKLYRNTKVFSGSTILADGNVALILDAYKLTELAEAEEFLERKNSFGSAGFPAMIR
ncbi:MAG: chemotaxis protein CheA [Desulfococcaceae bacterium]